MAGRATWKGLLKIRAVTIPIAVVPATASSAALGFHQLHAACSSRVTQTKWCDTCEHDVSTAEIVKGFEFAQGRYVTLSAEDLDTVRPLSTRVIDLVQFAAEASLDPIYIDRSYYLQPDGPRAIEPFLVLRDAMTGTVGIGKVAIYGREYVAAVRVRAGAFLLHTLHHAADIRPVDVVDGFRVHKEVTLARRLIAAARAPLQLAAFVDDYQADLQRLIDAKIAGAEILAPAIGTPALLPLREALTQSLLAAAATAKKIPAKVPSKKKPAPAAGR